MKSFQIWAQYLTELKSWRVVVLLVIAVFSYLVPWSILVYLDRTAPVLSMLAQIGLLALAYLWLAEYFHRRKAYIQRWGDEAYRHAFKRHILTGLPVVFAVLVHIAYMQGERIVQGWITRPVEVTAWYLILTGVLLDLRAIFAFGWDNLALVYVYFPEKGRLVRSSIYQVIRHPVYSALIRIGLALGLWRGTWASIGSGLILPTVFMFFWLNRVEEPDLIERFGIAYLEYRKKTPAFWPRLRDLGKFYRFLLFGERGFSKIIPERM